MRGPTVLLSFFMVACSQDVVPKDLADVGRLDARVFRDARTVDSGKPIDASQADAGPEQADAGPEQADAGLERADAMAAEDASLVMDAMPLDSSIPDAGPQTPVWEALLNNRIGFGRNARGGQGGSVCWVENLNDRGSGSLRNCIDGNTPVWIRFRVSGRIRLNSRIDVDSFTTIDGRGEDVTITRFGLRIRDKRHIIIHNLKFDDGTGNDEDAIQIVENAQHIWVNHVSFSRYTDGLLDITRGATDVTVSWCKFFDHDKTMLISANTNHTMDTNIRVTLHHNWFSETTQRHPRIRFGKVHAFNNYYHRWGSYAIGASHRSQLRSQANIFEPDRDYDGIITQVGSDPDQGEVRTDDDWRVRVNLIRARLNERNRNNVFDPSDFYSYTVDTADATLRTRIQDSAGWEDVPLP